MVDINKIIDAINADVDDRAYIGAETIADRIIEDVPEVAYGFAQGVVYALARLVEMYDQPSMASSILKESRVDVSEALEYDVSFLRREDKALPKGRD